jgi:hypothetical protein
LHTRTIILDGREAFVGSQSLRPPELDSRREIGIIVRDSKVVQTLLTTFEKDWESTGFDEIHDAMKKEDPKAPPPAAAAKASRVMVKEMKPLATTVKQAIKKAVAKAGEDALVHPAMKSTLKGTVKKAVKQAVKELVQEEQGR